VARRPKLLAFAIPLPPPDTRPAGVVKFASPLGDIEGQVHTFNEPPSRGTGEFRGVRPMSKWGDPYGDMHHKRQIAEGEATEDVDG